MFIFPTSIHSFTTSFNDDALVVIYNFLQVFKLIIGLLTHILLISLVETEKWFKIATNRLLMRTQYDNRWCPNNKDMILVSRPLNIVEKKMVQVGATVIIQYYPWIQFCSIFPFLKCDHGSTNDNTGVNWWPFSGDKLHTWYWHETVKLKLLQARDDIQTPNFIFMIPGSVDTPTWKRQK